MTFRTPVGLLLALAALLPLLALGASALRAEQAARRIDLEPAARKRLVLPAALAAGVCVLLGLAAAQPELKNAQRRTVRTESQVMFVVDVSRSMAAARSISSPTRLARARAAVVRLRTAVPDVPSGLAGLTDRVLPYLFPTAAADVFDETLRRSVALESPPPQQVNTNATSFAALTALARDGFFDRTAKTRTCVLVTDGETHSYATEDVARALDGPRGCRLLVVRVGGGNEHVFGVDGSPEAGYAPDPAAAAKARQLAEVSGGRAFDEGVLDSAAAALRSAASVGPVRREVASATTRALAPYAAALALLLTVVLVVLRLRRPRLRLIRTYA